jgi:hypothetical protein
MKRILTLAGAALLATALSACSPGINEGIGNRITFDSNGMVVHALGHPNAFVSRNGDLSIDGKAVAVSAAQRQLLQRYYQEAVATMDSGKTVGKQGIEMAAHGIGAAFASIFHDDPSPAEKKVDAQSDQMEAAASKLCADIKALGAAQSALAAELPAFAPYASGDRMQCTITHGTTYKDNGAKSSSFTYALREGGGPDVPAIHATSKQVTHPGESKPSTSSQP